MTIYGRSLLTVFAVFALLGGVVGNAQADVTVTGVANPQYLISGMPVISEGDAVLKMIFENKTPGTNISLCAGTMDDFAQEKCSMHLSGAGGPGFGF